MSLAVSLLVFVAGFVVGIIFHAKVIDQPETQNTIKINKIKRSNLYDPEKMLINEPPAPREKKRIREYFNRKKQQL